MGVRAIGSETAILKAVAPSTLAGLAAIAERWESISSRLQPAVAIEMAFGIMPPPLGTTVRNLGQAAELLYDHPLHMFLLAGPYYSKVIIKATNPAIWELARAKSS